MRREPISPTWPDSRTFGCDQRVIVTGPSAMLRTSGTAQRAAELSRRDPLTLNRDLALKSLNALMNKTAELQPASTIPTNEVRFAAPAVPPLRPDERLSLVGGGGDRTRRAGGVLCGSF